MLDGYHAVGNKCAVDFEKLNLPISKSDALEILCQRGFRVVDVDLVALARKCVGGSFYRRGAPFYQAPFTVDCSTLTKWVYAKAGIWLPRHSIDQRAMGQAVAVNQIEPGDLVFTAGAVSYWYHNPANGVGHVGLATGAGTVIHAANKKRGVVEEELGSFTGRQNNYREARRVKVVTTVTLECPSNRVVEWSGEIRNIIVQNLGVPDEVE